MTIPKIATIPFVDLRPQHDELRAQIEDAFARALDESAFIGGPSVASFEQAFARFCGSRHAIAVSNGTSALEESLRALGIGRGDLVVTVPDTFVATAEAAVRLGVVTRFVDVDPTTYNMDPALLEEYLTEQCRRGKDGTLRERASGLRVAALLPVHLYGLPADMPRLLEIAGRFGLEIVEDACQAHGADVRLPDGRWARAGTLGRIGCFSFYPGKNLGAIGDAGAVVTDDDELADRIRLLHEHGQRVRYVHLIPDGGNSRMDAIQAAVLELKLGRLEEWNNRRRQAAGWYAEELAGAPVKLPVEPDGYRHVYHLYVVCLPERDRVRDRLAEQGVNTGLHYPIPLHLQEGFAGLELGPGSFPAAEALARDGLSLPMFPHITREQVARVAACLRESLA